MPEGPAQHPLAQSAVLRHWPPMNCFPLPLPTFLAPEGSKAGPPLEAVASTAAGAAAGDSAGAAGAGEEDPPPKPQPVFPCWVAAPGPEQIPVGLAQQPLAQSASERHCPVINCLPWLLPTFLAPLGSKGGTAATKEARAKIVAVIVMDFIMVVRVVLKRKCRKCV